MIRWFIKSVRALILFLVLFSATSHAAEWLLVTPQQVQRDALSAWKSEGFSGVVLLLDETNVTAVRAATASLDDASMPFHYWIEVGRNVSFANAHPEWMASPGMHEDWRKNFPKAPQARAGEVVKAFPWVPINYKDAFDAHLKRVEQLLRDAPTNHSGVLLDHLQGGPSSCGCGNLQCRWATDYHMPATGTRAGDDAAAQFVRAVQKFIGAKPVVPVWTTECEHDDLPATRRADRKSTGLCGMVGCATGSCPKEFAKQWESLTKDHRHPVALLALHNDFARTNAAFAQGPAWVPRTVAYLEDTLREEGKTSFPRSRLWLVVQGVTRDEERSARKSAANARAANVIVSRVPLDQSFEPRVVKVGDAPR
jgi:hypothetical protein